MLEAEELPDYRMKSWERRGSWLHGREVVQAGKLGEVRGNGRRSREDDLVVEAGGGPRKLLEFREEDAWRPGRIKQSAGRGSYLRVREDDSRSDEVCLRGRVREDDGGRMKLAEVEEVGEGSCLRSEVVGGLGKLEGGQRKSAGGQEDNGGPREVGWVARKLWSSEEDGGGQ
ncbi:hypothetical protein FNV43_RR04213 [Rhamnella rubrinervis]|uniref:Uncharacterized protein n=1 Tax=Rhamnella rubrinervis TaxID=2594499 RepID=A0A8K0MPK4_9ROSA|nr:hypothetical protein FNV43_RR04213 [Rhamnella rubrinervis]